MMTEMYDWVDDPRFTLLFNRLKHKEEFQARFDEWLLAHTKEEIFKLGAEWRVPVNPVPSFEEIVEFPQYKEREFFISVQHPKMGEVLQPGAPFRMSETPWKIRQPAPLLGEHNDLVYSELGLSTKRLEEFIEKGVI